MNTNQEGHGPAEGGPPGGLVTILARWEDSGGQWEVLSSNAQWMEIGLFTCDGTEQMGRVRGARTSVLRDYLKGRTRSAE